ncbi:MAG: hypothetical protein K0R29_467 [Pseudobdellovibrio sp.]|nr:hypothetical protein [Pseudobdellovibrio sp.]
MKILFTAILLASTIATAKTQDRVIAQVVGIDPLITSALLTESGKLIVVQKNKKAESLNLVASVKQEMMYSVQMLAQAEIATDRREVVCMMIMPEYSLQNLKVLDAETNMLKLVLSNNSCAMSEYVYPKEAYLLDQAQTLKSQLVILAKQLVK